MPRYDVLLEGRTESSTCYFGVAVMADDRKEAEYLGHEAGRRKHRECDEIEVVSVMSVTSDLNAGKGRLCQRVPLKERALKLVKEDIKNGRKRLVDATALEEKAIYITGPKNSACHAVPLGLIQAAPTIDPETLRPVAHIIRGTVPETKDGVFCDNCRRCLGDEYGSHVLGYFKYCPYCGFKLEDGTEEET